MKRPVSSILCVLLALVLLLCACTPADMPEVKPTVVSVSLWAMRDGPLGGELEELIEGYNAAGPSVPMELRLFDSEQSLADAMDSARPDLLLCRADHALALYGQGRLKSLDGELPGCVPAFRELSECVGVSYFPLCADVQLLAVNAALPTQIDSAVLSSMDRLLTAAADRGAVSGWPFFGADSYAALFAACLSQVGEGFYAQRSEDIRSDVYRRLYNQLAGAAYTGALAYEEADLLPALSRGELMACLAPSSRLSGADANLLFYPMPIMQGGEKICLAEVYGLAVTSPFRATLPYVEDFLRWFCTSEISSPALLKAGLLPAAEGPWPELGGSLVGALRATLDSYRFYLPAADSGYRLHGPEFEKDFRAALALLR